MSMYRVGVIGGDGIGPEVVHEALKVLQAAGMRLEAVPFDLGAAAYLRTGEVLADETLAELATMDAVLLGAIGPAIGSTEVPPGLLERGLLLRLRFELDLYINLRPFLTPGGTEVAGKPGVDLMVVRENTEGSYAGEGGVLRKGTPHEIATQGSVNTRFGVERCIRYAYELAAKRPRKSLTLVHKTNVLTYAGDLWSRTFEQLSEEYNQVSTDYVHVDAACIHLVERPERFDVMVTDNLFGDILTDLAGALAGGIGLAASANLNPARTGPSLFEPVHGAAHDIAGSGKANPLAAISSAAMMAEYLGEEKVAANIKAAVAQASSDPAISGSSTREIGEYVARKVG